MAYSEETKKQILELLAEGKFSDKEISFEMDISISTIQRWKKEVGLTRIKREDTLDLNSPRDTSESPIILRKATQEEKDETSKAIQDALASGDEKQIMQAYERRIALVPKDKIVRNKLAKILIEQDKLQEAKKILEVGLKINPKYRYFWDKLAGIAAKQGGRKEAIKLLKKALEIDPDDCYFLTKIEIIEAFDSGDEKQIMQAYERRIALVPKDKRARSKLANILIEQDRLQEARDILEDGLKIDPNNRYFLYKLAEIVAKQGDREKVEVLKTYPNNYYLLHKLATIAIQQGDKEEAFKLFSRITQLEPKNLGAYTQMFYLSTEHKEKVKYATIIQEIIHGLEREKALEKFNKKRLRRLRQIDKKTKEYCISKIQVEEEKDTKDGNLISETRKKMSDGDITSSEANDILESIADDTSIAATALKAEIYIRVFSNFKGAKKVIQDRAKQEGTTSIEKRLLQEALTIVERAQKGISPRELGNIR